MSEPESPDRGGKPVPPIADDRGSGERPADPRADSTSEVPRRAEPPQRPPFLRTESQEPPGRHVPPPAPPVHHAPLQPSKKTRTGAFFFGALSGCLIVFAALFFLALFAALQWDSDQFSLARNKVAIIEVDGEILDARDTLDQIHRYAENNTVKAIVIRINSPGGAIAPSQEIYSTILRIRDHAGKPIVASLDSVAASGGYYIASACDKIVANPGTITGSIGVILQWFDVKDLIQWAKLKPETITSGAMKDAGSPYRAMTDPERAYFQGIVAQLHSQFVRDVARGRRIPQAEVARIADGRVFTGEQALALKLVDELGTIDDAVRSAGVLGGIEGEPARVWPRADENPLLLDLLRQGNADAILEKIVNRRVPQFLYRWQ